MQTGFVAGTLIHTKEGLRPIEQIAIGDYVLSKPENGEGKAACKRVVRTVKWDDCEAWFVSWYDSILHEETVAKRITQQQYLDAHGNSFVITTPNQLFWVEESDKEELFYASSRILSAYGNRPWPHREWVRADLLEQGMKLTLQDGRVLELSEANPAYRTDKANQAWVPRSLPRGDLESEADWASGIIIKLENGRVLSEVPLEGYRVMENEFYKRLKANPNEAFYNEGWPPDTVGSSRYRSAFYNLEVEDFHNYFLDTLGVWAHDADSF
ncbi:hypothetical protein [Pseudomonas benzopyrenica]|uniref:hypothetical protein n=1 Tax=Pseudomonas benzopyrenica TaxID=2993566 RepID=UPI003F18694C